MGRADYFKHGDWNAICDRCGFKFKASDLKLEYTGLRVCKWCFDFRHPQESLRVRPEHPSVPWVRTEPDDTEREIDGPELVPDPFFNDGSTWAASSSFTISDSQATADGVEVAPTLSTGTIVEDGKTYTVTIVLDSVTAGSISFALGGASSSSYDSAQTITEDLTASADGNLNITGASNFAGTISKASVKRQF